MSRIESYYWLAGLFVSIGLGLKFGVWAGAITLGVTAIIPVILVILAEVF